MKFRWRGGGALLRTKWRHEQLTSIWHILYQDIIFVHIRDDCGTPYPRHSISMKSANVWRMYSTFLRAVAFLSERLSVAFCVLSVGALYYGSIKLNLFMLITKLPTNQRVTNLFRLYIFRGGDGLSSEISSVPSQKKIVVAYVMDAFTTGYWARTPKVHRFFFPSRALSSPRVKPGRLRLGVYKIFCFQKFVLSLYRTLLLPLQHRSSAHKRLRYI